MSYTNDKAGKKYWDDIYSNISEDINIWVPQYYCERLIESMLIEAIEKYRPKTIMEIGCGNSNWLPYINRKYGIEVYGIDYSEKGCELVKHKLVESQKKNIFCINLLDEEKTKSIQKVDMVFSLGVVEHFNDPNRVIGIFKSFLNTDGILLTEIPNMRGKNGIITWIYQPRVFKIHMLHTELSLKEIYDNQGLEIKKCSRLGNFTYELFAWGSEPRIKCLEPLIQRYVVPRLIKKKSKDFRNAPFIYIIGQRK